MIAIWQPEQYLLIIFFVHWIREIDTVRYGDDQPVLPLMNNLDI